ncbi:hypothetical protein PVAG01_08612 [Phlyctema vagabunda]|uniref:polynucleotide adenylyltransferase n=1 Tax=Phlyctema vagabunda TaxID=108571 RepID=A0ABR4P9Z3_9HELO
MWPTPVTAQQYAGPGGGLEDRLRGLILNNANTTTANVDPVQAAPANPAFTLPPHMTSATTTEQQEYIAHHESRFVTQLPPAPLAAQPLKEPVHQGSRKKPNQAQRRKLNSELSIPISGRSNQQPGPHARGNNFQGQSPSPRGVAAHNGYFQIHQDPRLQQNAYLPQSQGPSAASPYPPHMNLQQGSPHPTMQQYHANQPTNYGAHAMQSPSQQWTNANNPGAYGSRGPVHNRQLYQPGGAHHSQGRGRPIQASVGSGPEDIQSQSSYLEDLLSKIVPYVGIQADEVAIKENFRAIVEKACQEAVAKHEIELENQSFNPLTVQLKCFGSMSSGFATKASDMDLALLSPFSHPSPEAAESPIPRLLEKKLLSLGYGARLLTKTRVPIIKLCEKPTAKLMSDLLEARTKWETGFNEDEDDEVKSPEAIEVEEEKPHSKTTDPAKSPLMSKSTKTSRDRSPGPGKGSPTETGCDNEHKEISTSSNTAREPDQIQLTLSKLKQKESQSLGDYYNLAKRLLRKLGARDISTSSPVLSEHEYTILNETCKSFVSGLSSQELVSRLCGYKTIAPLFDTSLPSIQRSLQGVWHQVDGERLAMVWEERPLTEAIDRNELEGLSAVQAWRELQDKEGALTEPLAFSRLLYVAAERLKKISSLRLVFFDQMHHEDPQYYEARAQKIMEDLGSRDPQRSPLVVPIIIAHYINGILNPQIREELQNPRRVRDSLKHVAFQHSVLQLAADYEHALTTDLFNESDRQDIQDYIVVLRSVDIVEPNLESDQMRLLIAPLVSRVRKLPDPTQRSLNKPRERYNDHLEFPKTDIGIQCDINFSAHLAIHNTLLLRCYSHSDPRVRCLVLFIKNWAKVRGINTPYRGTLSSYGYVLMVLHYLVNVAQPFVCPNLQALRREPPAYLPPSEIEAQTTCHGHDVRFWRNEAEIKSLADRKMLNHNHDSVGVLLRGFFEYYAQSGQMTTVQDRGFDWGREVLSLRSQRGIITKQEKGWVGARTVVETTTAAAPPTASAIPHLSADPEQNQSSTHVTSPGPSPTDTKPKAAVKTVEEVKEIRHRYLFAIEDPFELDHNVARTVTHNGIVQIRDEFRRAWRIIRNVGRGGKQEDLLEPLDPAAVANESKGRWMHLMKVLHGPEIKPDH